MQRVAPRFLLALLCPALAGTDAHAAPPVRSYSIERLMASNAYGGLSFSPDGATLLVDSAESGIPNLYAVPVAGGATVALTHSTTDPIGAIGYFADDNRVLYIKDHGGDERNHVFVLKPDGSSVDLTPGETLKAKFVAWAADHESFFLATNERDPRFFDLYEYDAANYARRLLFKNDGAYQICAVSPDRRHVALMRIVDNANIHAYLYDTATGSLRQLTPDNSGISEVPQVFTADGKGLIYTSDAGSEFAYLERLDLETGGKRDVYRTHWDIQSAGLSRDGRYLAAVVDEDARETLRLFDAATLRPVAVPDLGPGAVKSVAIANGAPLAAVVESDGQTPGDVVLVDFKAGTKRLLLQSLSPDVAASDLVLGKVVRFKSYDGLEIPGILFIPHQAEAAGRGPAVIFVHGGPGDESQVGYKPLTQYLVNRGYVVFEINNRGSRGSGKTFSHLDDHHHGSVDLDDVVSAKTMLAATGYADPARVAIMGQSYGGFMALAGLAFRPLAFAAGVDLYGVSDWVRLLPNTPSWWEDLRRSLMSEMGDWRDPAQLQHLKDISPVLHARSIRRPLLVLQGANDPRVLPDESKSIVAEVKANGVPVQYVEFPDEGHGFRKKANQIVAYGAIAAFLDTYVGDGIAPKPHASQETGR